MKLRNQLATSTSGLKYNRIPVVTLKSLTILSCRGNGTIETWEMLEDVSLISEEIWKSIFRKIDTSTIARMGLTSLTWRSMILKCTVQLEFGHDTGDGGLFRRLIVFPNLESLTIYSSEVANRALLRYACPFLRP